MIKFLNLLEHIAINIIRIILNVVVVRNGKKIELKGCWHNDIDPKVDASYNGSKVARILVPKVHMAKN